jgi:GWxTD domain-containing protein
VTHRLSQMTRHRFATVLGCVVCALCLGRAPLSAQAEVDLFNSGTALERSGKWQEALDVWASLPDELTGSGRSHPGAGPAFLATAIEHDQGDRLEEATAIYMWSFSGSNLEEHRDEVELEGRRILPLLSRRDSVLWMPLFEGPVQELAFRIGRYWLEHDPTPETPVNERLVEHWERIVQARDQYQYNRSSVYETDDRGVIFVKYGPPDTRSRGSLGANEMELKIRIADSEARARMRRFDSNPQFELWKFEGLNPEEFTFYLFGNTRGTGPFELVEGPLDLIGDAARSLASAGRTPGGVRAQHYLELFYYRDLAILGGRFGRRFDELSDLWDGYTMRRNVFGTGGRPSPTAPTLEAFSYRFAEEDRYDPIGVATISVRSDFEGAARAVEMVVQAVRVLDPSNQPMLIVQALSAPRLKVGDRERRAAYRSPLRDTEHTLILRNRKLEEAGRITQMAPAAGGGISVFHLLQPPQPMHLTIFGKPVGGPAVGADTLSLAGQGHAYAEEPLRSDVEVFEVSDLAVGTPWDVAPGEASPLPFPLLPGMRVWTGDALRVYLELYHLRATPDGTSPYALDFRLLPLDALGAVQSSPKPVTLGIQLESNSPTAQRHFDIGLAGLGPGFYRLEVDATDLTAAVMITRTIEIEIIG